MSQVIAIQTFPAWGYLIVDKEIVAVDVGAPSVARKMVDVVIGQLHRQPTEIKLIVATHYHVDHIGGISELRKHTPAKVMFHQAAQPFVEGLALQQFPPLYRWINMLTNRIGVPEPSASSDDLRQLERIGIPFSKRPASFPVAGYFSEGDLLPGADSFRVIETPGHTTCSVCFFNDSTGELISGDTIMGGLQGPESNTYVVSRAEIARSADKLKKLQVKKLYPGHGLILTGDSLLKDMNSDPLPDGIGGLVARLKARRVAAL